MRKKKSKFFISMAVLTMGFCSVCSAAASEDNIIACDQFRNEECEEFQYRNIAWDTSVEEVLEALPYEIAEADLGIPPEEKTAVYQSKDVLEFGGMEASADFEFVDNKLNSVKFTVSDLEDGYEEWFEEQAEELAEIYGTEYESRENESEFFNSKIYKWRENDTLLEWTLLTGEGVDPTAMVGVWRFPDTEEGTEESE